MNGQCFESTYPLASHNKPKGGLDTLLEGNKPVAFPGDRPSPGAPASAGAVTPSHNSSIPLGHLQCLCYLPLALLVQSTGLPVGTEEHRAAVAPTE